jgi:hypothetical protein
VKPNLSFAQAQEMELLHQVVKTQLVRFIQRPVNQFSIYGFAFAILAEIMGNRLAFGVSIPHHHKRGLKWRALVLGVDFNEFAKPDSVWHPTPDELRRQLDCCEKLILEMEAIRARIAPAVAAADDARQAAKDAGRAERVARDSDAGSSTIIRLPSRQREQQPHHGDDNPPDSLA